MADFTSSLYLGMTHPSDRLGGWSALTTGRPAVLGRPPEAQRVADQLARLAGAERATLSRSTLHAFADCLDVLAGSDAALVVDARVYPVARWAVQRAAGGGVPVVEVGHQDIQATRAAIRRLAGGGHRPVVLADGLCGGCGRRYPVAEVRAAVHRCGGTLLLDDTQALGILGSRPGPTAPYGSGGGGTVRNVGGGHDSVVTVSSMAKAFGVPAAAVLGSARSILAIAGTGSAVHSSPPSAADIAAGAHALGCNAAVGDELRAALAGRVAALRAAAAAGGLALTGGQFPVQNTPPIHPAAGRRLLDRLADDGVVAVLRSGCEGGGSVISLLITVDHPRGEIVRAARLLVARWAELSAGDRRTCHAT
jgi:8-amino-7-oxononanoate synthase